MGQATTLIELQKTDTELMRAQKQLDEMPEKRAILETRKKIGEIEQLRLKAEELVRKLKQVSSKHEDEIAQVTDKFNTEQEKVMSGEVSNPKEIQHLTREMDSLRRRREKLEIDQLEVMERVENAEGQVAKVDAAIEGLKKKEAEHTAAFTERGGSIQSEMETLGASRSKLAGSLDASTLEQYESLRESKGGVAVGVLNGDACTACRMELPAQEVSRLRAGDEIALCPVCKRMLVVTPAEDEE